MEMDDGKLAQLLMAKLSRLRLELVRAERLGKGSFWLVSFWEESPGRFQAKVVTRTQAKELAFREDFWELWSQL